MPVKAVVFCGFMDVCAHLDAKTLEDVRDLNAYLMFYQNVNVPETYWAKERLKLLKYLRAERNFKGGKIGMKNYRDYFTLDTFMNLEEDEKKRHTYRNCSVCAVKHQPFELKKFNEEFISKEKYVAKNVIKTNKMITKLKNETTPKTVTQMERRKMFQQTQQEQKTLQVKKDMEALYSSTMSARQWNIQRKLTYGEYKNNPERDPVGPLTSYIFNKEEALKILNNNCDNNKELGDNMRGYWTKMANDVHLEKKDSITPVINKAQVMQKYATSEGFTFNKKKCQRVTWRKIENTKNLVVSKPSSYEEIKKLKDKLIEDGIIDLGEQICPRKENKTYYNKENNLLETRVTKKYGRKIHLSKIRDYHLNRMEKMNLFRGTNPANMNREQIIEQLNKYKVQFTLNSSTEHLRHILEEEVLTLHLTCWTDHAEVLNQTYYIISVWYVYNDRVYKTESEYGKKVEPIVERPYLHIIAKSKSSVADQKIYLNDRIKDLKDSTNSITFMGRTYKDVVRFQAGDLPSRLYEAGNNISGNFRCSCGVNIASSKSSANIYLTGPFQSIQDRVDHFNKSAHLEKSIDKMKKTELEDALISRGIEWEFEEPPAKMRKLLKTDLKGVKSLPPILSKGDSLAALNCTKLEIMQLDPLHDLKNMIQGIFNVLPNCTKGYNYYKDIDSYCKSILDQRQQLRGCDYRKALLELITKLEETKYQLNRQWKELHRTLYALSELQRLAYQRTSKRSPKDILRINLMALQFGTGCCNIFKGQNIFGAPFHSLVNHYGETYRLVSLRSTVTETAERQFSTIKKLTKSTNANNENFLNNIMIRTHFHNNAEQDIASQSFLSSQSKLSEVSKTAENIMQGTRTIWTKSFIEQNKVAVLCTMKKISDFLIEGEGAWYTVDEHGYVMFKDGNDDPSPSTRLSHLDYRSESCKSLHLKLCDLWGECREQAGKLNLSVLKEISRNTK